jgi:hypothetical protein
MHPLFHVFHVARASRLFNKVFVKVGNVVEGRVESSDYCGDTVDMARNLDGRQKLPLRFRSETLRLCCSVISNFFLTVLHASSFLPAVVGFVQKRHMM